MPRSKALFADAIGAFRIVVHSGKGKPMFSRLCIVAASLFSAGVATGPAGAQSEKVLTVYTYSSFAGEYGPGATIKERFEAECGCTLEWVQTDDAGTLLARLKLEGESTEADVVLGLDNNLMAEAAATGLFAPHGIETGRLDLPVAWDDGDFFAFRLGLFRLRL